MFLQVVFNDFFPQLFLFLSKTAVSRACSVMCNVGVTIWDYKWGQLLWHTGWISVLTAHFMDH